jgi:dihydrofolate reductase
MIVNELLKERLIDESTIFIIPTLVGNNIRLFQDERLEQRMESIQVKAFDTILV